MKKYIFFIGIMLIALVNLGQVQNTSIKTVTNDSTEFSQLLPKGTTILDLSQNKMYVLTSATDSTGQTLKVSSKYQISSSADLGNFVFSNDSITSPQRAVLTNLHITDTLGIGTTAPEFPFHVRYSRNFATPYAIFENDYTIAGGMALVLRRRLNGEVVQRGWFNLEDEGFAIRAGKNISMTNQAINFDAKEYEFKVYRNSSRHTALEIDTNQNVQIFGALTVNDRIEITNTGNSIFIGDDAGLLDDGTDNNNIGVGYQSLNKITSGFDNIAIGYMSMSNSGTNALRNVGIGSNTMTNATSFRNTALGHWSLTALSGGQNNTGIGANSLVDVNNGSHNVSVGGYSGGNVTDGYYNTYIGYDTDASGTSVTNEISLGARVVPNGTNTATIGDDNITDVYIGEDAQASTHTGALYTNTAIKTASYSTTSSDHTLIANSATQVVFTVHDPTTVRGQILYFFNKGSATAGITANLYDACTGIEISQGQGVILQSDGTHWLLISSSGHTINCP